MRAVHSVLLPVFALVLAGCSSVGAGADPETPPDTTETPEHEFTYYGKSRAAAIAIAEENGARWRIAREDERRFPLTRDLVPGRVTFEIDDGVVVLALIEGDGGWSEGCSDVELRPFLGLTERMARDRATAADLPFRVTRRDDEQYAVTTDYLPDRINVQLRGDVVVHVSGG